MGARAVGGKTVAEVGDVFDGDLLGGDPKGAWSDSASHALKAAEQDGAMETTAHLSFGDFPGRAYISQVLCDHIMHSWDLARGIGEDEKIDPELVEFAYDFYEPQADAWRAGGAFGPRVEVSEDAELQTKLLGLAGRKA